MSLWGGGSPPQKALGPRATAGVDHSPPTREPRGPHSTPATHQGWPGCTPPAVGRQPSVWQHPIVRTLGTAAEPVTKPNPVTPDTPGDRDPCSGLTRRDACLHHKIQHRPSPSQTPPPSAPGSLAPSAASSWPSCGPAPRPPKAQGQSPEPGPSPPLAEAALLGPPLARAPRAHPLPQDQSPDLDLGLPGP